MIDESKDVIRNSGESNLATTFVTAESKALAALAKTRLTDLNEANNFVRLLSWLERHNVSQGYADAVASLVARTAIGGYNLALASMTETGIISPEAMGVPLSRHAIESLKKEREMKLQRQQNLKQAEDNSK